MIVTIFRSSLRPEHAEEYGRWADEMHRLAETIPGFRSLKTFTAADGERVSLVEFESEETHNAWRDHAEHRKAQRLGRERFYSQYQIQVCTVRHQSSFPRE